MKFKGLADIEIPKSKSLGWFSKNKKANVKNENLNKLEVSIKPPLSMSVSSNPNVKVVLTDEIVENMKNKQRLESVNIEKKVTIFEKQGPTTLERIQLPP